MLVFGNEKCVVLVLVLDLYGLVLFPLTVTLSLRSFFTYLICAAVFVTGLHEYQDSVPARHSAVYIHGFLKFSGYVIFFKQ